MTERAMMRNVKHLTQFAIGFWFLRRKVRSLRQSQWTEQFLGIAKDKNRNFDNSEGHPKALLVPSKPERFINKSF